MKINKSSQIYKTNPSFFSQIIKCNTSNNNNLDTVYPSNGVYHASKDSATVYRLGSKTLATLLFKVSHQFIFRFSLFGYKWPKTEKSVYLLLTEKVNFILVDKEKDSQLKLFLRRWKKSKQLGQLILFLFLISLTK